MSDTNIVVAVKLARRLTYESNYYMKGSVNTEENVFIQMALSAPPLVVTDSSSFVLLVAI
jgi:hypothetical protein